MILLAPVLHDNLPRKMVWFTGGFPLLAYWLSWGGSGWGPLMIIAMLAVAFLVYRSVAAAVNSVIGLLAAFATIVIWLLFLQGALSGALQSAIPMGLEPVESSKLGGFLITFIIGVTGIVASLPIGILLALGRGSDMPTLRMICVCFIEFIRGVPLITLLFMAS